MELLSIIKTESKNFDSKKVERQSLSTSVVFFKISGRYFLK